MRRGFKFWYLAAAAGVLLLLGLAFQAGSLRQTVAVEQAAQTAPEQAPAPEQQEERPSGGFQIAGTADIDGAGRTKASMRRMTPIRWSTSMSRCAMAARPGAPTIRSTR